MFDIESADVLLNLGNQIEDNATQLQFDISKWTNQYPGGIAAISYMRPNSASVHLVPINKLTLSDGVLTWTVTDEVTEYPGHGSAVISYQIADITFRSPKFTTFVREGLPPAGDAPAPVANWLDEAQLALNKITNLRFEINNDGELEVYL